MIHYTLKAFDTDNVQESDGILIKAIARLGVQDAICANVYTGAGSNGNTSIEFGIGVPCYE